MYDMHLVVERGPYVYMAILVFIQLYMESLEQGRSLKHVDTREWNSDDIWFPLI